MYKVFLHYASGYPCSLVDFKGAALKFVRILNFNWFLKKKKIKHGVVCFGWSHPVIVRIDVIKTRDFSAVRLINALHTLDAALGDMT